MAIVEVVAPDEMLEGLRALSDMCGDHIAFLKEREEAMNLMAPANPDDWPSFPNETFLGALRNVLQAKASASDVSEKLMEMLEVIADELGFPRLEDEQLSWTFASLLMHVKGLIESERQALRFRRELVALLGLQPGVDPLDEIKRKLEGGVIKTPGHQRIESELRRDMRRMVQSLEATIVGSEHKESIAVRRSWLQMLANNLQVIHDSTVDA